MYDTVLVPTDGSTVAEAAGAYACELAQRFDADVHAIHVEEGSGLLGDDESSGEEAVAAVEDRGSRRDLEVTTAVLEAGEPVHREIIDYAEEHDVDLVVMGTHGRSGLDRFLVGSVAEQMLRESPVPVATVHHETRADSAIDRILVPSDGSPSALAAADHAIDLAAETDATIHVVHVTDQGPIDEDTTTYDVSDPETESGVDAVDDVLERARERGLETVDVSTPSGRVDQTILAIAVEHDADCIVMGTHGRTGIRRYLLGSTTERVVRFASVPVYAVRGPRTETVAVEYLDYATVDERGWSIEDDDLFEKAATADLDPESHGTIDVARDEYVLDAAEDDGHDWPFYCRAGGCVNCAAIVIEGEIEMDVQRSLSDEEVTEQNLRLTCVGTPASDEIKLVYNAQHLDTLQDRVV